MPAWFALFTAGLAAYFAGKNLRVTNRQLKLATENLESANEQLAIARDDKHRQIDADRKEQAAKIAVWLTGDLVQNHVHVAGHNGSEVPVYNAHIWLKQADGDAVHLIHLPVLAPTNGREDVTRASRALSHWAFGDQAILVALREKAELSVALSFTDTKKVHWYRDFDGNLSETAQLVVGPS